MNPARQRRSTIITTASILVILASIGFPAFYVAGITRLGKQPDGGFVVATGQRIEPGTIAFSGRPIDLAMHPSGEFLAVLNQRDVFLANREGVMLGSAAKLEHGAAYRGIAWSPDGTRLFASVSEGYIQALRLEGQKLVADSRIEIKPAGAKGNPAPGGMAVTENGWFLFVAMANRNAVAEIDLKANALVREWPVQNIPFDVRLSADEKTLIVSNWGGRPAESGDETAQSMELPIVVDTRGVAATGTVSLIDRTTGRARHVEVGLHPTGIAVSRGRAYVANSASDSISVIDLGRAEVVQTIPLRWGKRLLFGSMPGALACRGDRLFACNGGDNALCEIDLKSGRALGFRPAGFYPTGIALSADGQTAFVVNCKGNGSVRKTILGMPGNAHDFQGTVSVIDLTADIRAGTDQVALNNGWNQSLESLRPNLAVYKGAIKHVLYIIKENRTYDEVFGDLPQGNGDAKLCGLGENVTPNHHMLALQFALFDNTYVSGTNSAEGHHWADGALANDYIERFYAGYSRTYPDDGADAMSLSSGGYLWDAAAKKGKTIRVYGEFCDDDQAKIEPKPKSWLDTWRDRVNKTNRYTVIPTTTVNSLRPYIHPTYIYWPLLMSDQWRADTFIEEYQRFSRENCVPNLMIMTLPCDHTEGTNPKYPKPKSMIADNDLALGRIVEAVSNSAQWKSTCIFVIEDDAQAGPDHVDGHRTVCLALGPYTRRGFVDSSFYTQISLVRSIELMLGLDPMNRFDAAATPFAACFSDTPDHTPYKVRPNRIALDDMNQPLTALKGRELFLAQKSLSLDWSGIDRADWYWLNRIVWHSVHGVDSPYPTK